MTSLSYLQAHPFADMVLQRVKEMLPVMHKARTLRLTHDTEMMYGGQVTAINIWHDHHMLPTVSLYRIYLMEDGMSFRAPCDPHIMWADPNCIQRMEEYISRFYEMAIRPTSDPGD